MATAADLTPGTKVRKRSHLGYRGQHAFAKGWRDIHGCYGIVLGSSDTRPNWHYVNWCDAETGESLQHSVRTYGGHVMTEAQYEAWSAKQS